MPSDAPIELPLTEDRGPVSTPRPTWIDDLINEHGLPTVAIEEPQKLHTEYGGRWMHRRCWVWFINSRNHNVKIDRHATFWEYDFCTPQNRITLSQADQITAEDARAALILLNWPCSRIASAEPRYDLIAEAGFWLAPEVCA